MKIDSPSRQSSGRPLVGGNNYIPEISEIGGFPSLSAIRLPDFFPRRLQASAACADVSPAITDSEDDDASSSSSSSSSFTTNALHGFPITPVAATTGTSFWPSLISTRVSPASLPSFQSLSVPSLPLLNLPALSPPSLPAISIPFGSPSFSFSRYLANYIFSNDGASDSESAVDSPSNRRANRSRSAGPAARRHRRSNRSLSRGPASTGSENPDTISSADAINMAKQVELLSQQRQNELRARIHEIQNMQVSDKERALKMHELMTEDYYRLRRCQDGEDEHEHEEDDDDEDYDITGLSAADKTVTWFDEECEVRGCPHYQRGVKLQCSMCEQWHTCRFCHDEVEDDHQLIRHETKNMLCMHCFLPQPAAQDCRDCGVRLARYYCEKCKLWDDDPNKSIYHCNDCGICRIGEGLGKDFFHCKTCNACMSMSLENSHRCIEHSTECNCPICGEYMFTSTMTVVFMSCGHSIHQKCYYEHTKNSYKCPTCARSIVNMEAQFRLIDREIERQRLPEPYSEWRSVISCNDCSAKSNVPFHFLGLRCDTCRSYNTAQVKIIKPEEGGAGTEESETVLQELYSNLRLGVNQDREYSDDEEVHSEVTEVLGDFEDEHSIFSLPSLSSVSSTDVSGIDT